MVRWKEELTREAIHPLMENFPSVADAIFELVDNAVDARRGRKITVDITASKEKDIIVVEDHGGGGMDAAGVAEWLRWGSGRKYSGDTIGMYHQGGKAAAGFLADSLKLYAKATGETDVWSLTDEDWRTRTDTKDWGEPEAVTDQRQLPASLRNHPVDDGFVRIEMRRLREHRYNLDTLVWRISNTYRWLLEDGDLKITVNTQEVQPLALPRSSAFDDVEIDAKLDGRRVRGWVGRLDRDAAVVKSGKRHIKGGIRCLLQGRLICEAEYFGHHAEGKGLLASLIGEVHVNHIRPLPNKTDFQRDSEAWGEVADYMHDFLKPIIAEFRRAGEVRRATKEERRNLASVCDELAETFRRVREKADWETKLDEWAGKHKAVAAPGGRARPEERNGHADPPSTSGQPRRPATEPPDDPVGKLMRLMSRMGGRDLRPPVVFDAFDPSVRTEWRSNGRSNELVINQNFCLYEQLDGSPGYLAETILLAVLAPTEGDPKTVDEYLGEVNNLLSVWAGIHEESE